MAIEDVHAYFSPYEWCNGFEDQYKSDQWEYLSTRGRFWAITQKLGRHFQNEPKLGIHYWQGFLPYLPYITKEEMHGIIQCYEQMVTS